MLCRLRGIPEGDAGQMVHWGDQIVTEETELRGVPVSVLFEKFLRRVSSFEVGELDRLRSNFIRGIKHLPVRLTVA